MYPFGGLKLPLNKQISFVMKIYLIVFHLGWFYFKNISHSYNLKVVCISLSLCIRENV